MPSHPFGPYGDHGTFWPLFGGAHPLVLFLVLIGVLVWAVIRVTGREGAFVRASAGVPTLPGRDPALDELRLRYARGELTREEFTERSRDLGGAEPSPSASAPPASG